MEDDTKKYVDEAFDRVARFSTPKYGDTPTSAQQLTPKGYVDGIRSFPVVMALDGTSSVRPTGWSTSKPSDAVWRVTHNLGTLNYAVALTLIKAAGGTTALTLFLVDGERTINDFEYSCIAQGSGLVNVDSHAIVTLL